MRVLKLKPRIKEEAVNSPYHYNNCKVECIDAMISTMGFEAVMDFCKCNAFKYLWRHMDKNDHEDILKANWYLNKYKELYETYLKEDKDDE